MNVLLSRCLSGLGSAAGKIAAGYKQSYECANAVAREDAKVNALFTAEMNTRPDYELYADVLSEAINNTADTVHMFTVKNFMQLCLAHPLVTLPSGITAVRYRGRYIRGSGLSAAEITRILQDEVDHICQLRGVLPIVIKVRLSANGVAIIDAVPAAVARDFYKQQLKKIQI